MNRPILVIANWKMHPSALHEAAALARKTERACARMRNVEIIIAPPFPFLYAVKKELRSTELGAQNMFWEKTGAYTGEVSPLMLKNAGVRYCIIGHSERRALGETDEVINKKIKAALANNIIPVLAIGEKRKMPDAAMRRTLEKQLKKDLAGISQKAFGRGVIAYEPVWAIGTGLSATPAHARIALTIIRETLAGIWKTERAATRILYGGSVDEKNAVSFVSKEGGSMDGMLVGGASLNAQEFIEIVRAVAREK